MGSVYSVLASSARSINIVIGMLINDMFGTDVTNNMNGNGNEYQPLNQVIGAVNINKTPIKHVVLLMLENRSLDQVFGYRFNYPKPFTVNGDLTNYNLDIDGNKIYQSSMTAFTAEDDATHDLDATLFSINGGSYISNSDQNDISICDKMGGFVISNQLKTKSLDNAEHTDPIDPREIMGYFPAGSFPVYEYIADNFTICDQWYASLPSCTLPNRAFGLCASSDGHINNRCRGDRQRIVYKCPTIFDHLNDAKLPWKVYYNDTPLSIMLEHQLTPKNIRNYDHFEQFSKDCENNTLPAFSFIEPEYGIESSLKKIDGVANGQNIVFDIIKSLQKNKEVYNDTLFVCYYDESGGFYDHVYPPPAPKPNDEGSNHSKEYTFDQYGLRVPALIVSPRVPAGVSSTLYDHTSVLSFIAYNWGLPYLTDRDRYANNLTDLLQNSVLREDIPNIPDNLREIDPSNSTTIRNRSMDVFFFKELVEKSFFGVLADCSDMICNENAKLHSLISKLTQKFK